MQNLYKKSELVLNPDGSLYHINLKSENIGDTVFLVGDPDRVPAVSAFFDKIEFKTQKREIVTHTGIKNGHRVSAISTGMGTDNIDIVIGEIDAAVNIDLEKKERRTSHRAINFIRLGTSGSLQEDIPVGSVLASSHGLGLDGLLHFYENSESFTQNSFIDNFIKKSAWNKNFARPYLVEAGANLFSKATDFFSGITATACGFYGPQGRALTLNVAEPLLNEKLTDFSHDGLRITNFEMETSGIYGLSNLMGHQALSVNMIIFNRITGDSLTDYRPNVSKMIGEVMDIYL